MATLFRFELVSPEEKLVSEDVGMVTLPGEEGVMGVLGGHSRVLTSLQRGVVEVRKGAINDNPRRLFVTGGFADVGPAHCTILAEEAIDLATLNAAETDARISAIASERAVATGAGEKAQIAARPDLLRAQRAALG